MRDTPFHLDTARAKVAALKVAALKTVALRPRSDIRGAPPPQTQKSRWWVKPNIHTAASALLVAGAYYVGALIGFSVTFKSSPISPIWPPNAILLVALLLAPMETWWLYLLAVCGAHMLIELPTGVPLVTASGLFLTNSAEAVIGAFLVRRFAGGPPWLSNLRQVAVYLICVVIVAPVVTSFPDAAVVVLTRWTESSYWLNWVARCVSNSLAELTIGPALLLGLTRAPSWARSASRERWIEAILLMMSVLLVGVTIFSGDIAWEGSTPVLIYAVLPLLLWAAVRFGTGATSAALLGITILATWSAVQGYGPFSTFTPVENVISLQLFLIGISVPMLFLAALMEERQQAVGALRSSEDRYRDLVESQSEMICRYLPDSTLTFVNEAYCQNFGKSREQLIGTKFLDLIDEPERGRHMRYIAELLACPHTSIDEHETILPDGSTGWHQWIDYIIRDASGNVVEFQAVGRDITDRKRAEAALYESEARFRAAFESAATGMMLVDTTGRTLQVNHPLAEMLGYSEEELLTHPFMDLTYPDDLDSNLALFRAGVAGETDGYQLEKRLIHKEGHLVWAFLSAGVVRDTAGQPRYFIGHVQDITKRKRSEEELRASEERYRAVVSNFPRGVVLLFEQNMRHVFADGQGLPELGLSKEAIEGKTIWEAFPGDLSAALAPRYQAALAGTHAAFDLAHAGHTYQTQVLPIQYAGATAGMVVMQDVTEQRRIEVLAELDRAKTAFFSNVSHEFRTPLTLLLGPAADALADREEPLLPHQRERLKLIQRGGSRLHKLVNTLLDFSRIEAGRDQARYESTDVATLTAELASTFRSAIERAGLRLVVECAMPADLPQPVYVDRDMWEKIVLNLLSNALKFTFEGDIAVEVRKSADRDEWIELEVRDTGTGIPAEDLPHLFERFYRVQGAQARTHEGTGIGLALVQELVRLHGGMVRVTSMPGMGSAFTVAIPTGDAHLPADRIASRAQPNEVRVRELHVQGATPFVEEALRWLPEPPLPALPLVEGTAAAVALDGHIPNSGAQPDGTVAPGADGTSAEATQIHTESATILVADDNADMRAYLARLLSARWDVRTVANGADALAAASAQPPDLILADVMMPGMDGFALVAALRDNPRTRALPVILLSARAGEEATVEGLQAGADDYLIKPFSARELLARVQTHLELARVRKEAAARAAQLDAVFEAIGDGVLVQDLEGHRTYANRAYRDLLRRHLEMQGHYLDPEALFAGQAEWDHYITISDEQDREMLPTEWPTERALRGETLTGANAVDEFTYGADGTVMKLNVAAAPIRGAEGQITGAVGVFRDVTVRRQLEQQVAEQASQLEAIFAAQADGVAVFDTEGRFLRSNRALNQIFGMDAETDYTVLSLSERMRRVLLFDEQGQRIPEAQWPHWRVLRGEVLAGANAMDTRMRTLDGREVWISTTGAPFRGPDGQLMGVVLVTRDVTVRRQLEQQVAEQASELQTIFEAMTDGVFVLDADGHVTRLNAAAHALFGQAPHDGLTAMAEGRVQAIELRDTEGRLLPLMQLPTQRVLRGEVLAGDDALTLMVRTYDERERTISLTGGALRDATGQITGAVGVIRDVTELRRIESALAEQERMFRTLVENSPDIITRFDRNLRHIYVSPASEAVTGISAHARLGKTYRQLGLPVGVYALWEHALRRAFTTGQQQVFETGYQASGRPPRVSQVRYIPEFAADGSVESVLGITTDITELKRAEEALRQSEERFAKAFHSSPIAMTILSVATRRLLDVNAAQLRLAGHSRDEMLGAAIGDLDLLAPADLDALSDQWRQESRVYEAPVRVRTKSGEIRSCRCSMGSIWVSGEECLLVTTLDVTEQERAEEALRQSEERFAKAFHASPVAMTIISRATRRILDSNAALSRLTGYRSSELLGATVSELRLLSSTNPFALRDLWRQDARGSEVPLHIRTKSGEIRSCLSSTARVQVGSEECLIVATRDITSRERVEKALQAATAVAEAAQHEEERRRHEAERREQIAESLREVLAILNSDRQVSKTLDFIARQASQLLSSNATAIFTTDTDGAQTTAQGNLTLQSAFGLTLGHSPSRSERRLSVGHTAIRRAMIARRAVAVVTPSTTESERAPIAHQHSDTPEQETQEALGVLAKQEEQTTLEVWEEDVVEASAEYLIVREEPLPAPYRALLAIPIIAQGRMYGGLLLLYTEPHRFSDDEVALAMAYGDQIALALANSRLQDHIERAAIEKERNRLARELHDTVTQEIFTASVLAESIPKVWEQHRVEAEANLQQLHQLTRGALAGLRTLLLELRPAVLEQKPLPDLLSQLGEAMATRSGVPITLAIADDAPPIPNPVKVAFYRIAQEALMNVAKYAQAHNIAVRLRYPNSGEAVQLDIQDDGQGFDTGAIPAGHFGVGMMRERARAVGATLRITSRREQGTRVAVKWVRSGRTASADQEYAAAGSTKHGDRRTD